MPEVVLHAAADFGDRLSLFNARTLTIVEEAQEYLATPGLEARLAVIPEALELAGAFSAEEALQLLHQHADHPEIAAVRDVFALSYLDQHATWYLTRGLLDITGVKTIKQELRAALDTLAANLPGLLDAFGLDDEILGAPVLSEDIPGAWDDRINNPRRH